MIQVEIRLPNPKILWLNFILFTIIPIKILLYLQTKFNLFKPSKNIESNFY